MNKQRGITLVALVVTIIVLIIFAGISLNTVMGENGIITKANEAKELQEIEEIKSEVKIEILAKETKNMKNITQNEIEEILEKYGTVNKNEDETIKSLTPTGKDYEISFEELYSGEILPSPVEIPEKSKEIAFDRSYGVIEIEFLEGTGYTTSTTPNEPNMGSNMKKVYWEEDGTEVIEGQTGFDETKWYNYIAQTGDTASGGTSKWANAVTVDDEEKITGYFVWIPRYAYRIVYFDTQENEDAYRLTGATDGIVGYSDARGFVHPDGTTPSDMETPVTSIAVGANKLRPHPAFEDGSKTGYTQGEWSKALEGIWIAKYETSGISTTLKSVPGVQALVSTDIGEAYTYALNYDKTKKSHMLKNSEWGAMAYLTESKYGRNGTAVSKNEDSGMYTGGAKGATVVSNPLQSTTGNYYGVYDTVGGCHEYATGYIVDSSTNIGNSFASTDNTYNNKTQSTQYATVYNMVSADELYYENYIKNINQKFGDGIIETSTEGKGITAWNSAGSGFIGVYNNAHYPFFRRGGIYYNSYAGSFHFDISDGIVDGYGSFRICLSIE